MKQRVRLLATACEQSIELIVVSHGNTIVYANEAFCRATGYSRDELEALTPAQLVASESMAATVPAVERLQRREPARLRLVLARKDATTFQADCAAAPIVPPDGTATHFVAVVRDLTDEVQIRDQLVKSERLSAIGQLVSDISHSKIWPYSAVFVVQDDAQDGADHVDGHRITCSSPRPGPSTMRSSRLATTTCR